MSVRPIIAATEGAAWDKANRILAGMTGKLGWARQEGVRAPVDNAGRRQFAFAQEKDVHDKRLWMGITKATGALGNTSCLVGTAEQVAEAILAYYRLGVSSFLIRGFDPVSDTTEFGRELIPRIKAGAIGIDKRGTPAAPCRIAGAKHLVRSNGTVGQDLVARPKHRLVQPPGRGRSGQSWTRKVRGRPSHDLAPASKSCPARSYWSLNSPPGLSVVRGCRILARGGSCRRHHCRAWPHRAVAGSRQCGDCNEPGQSDGRPEPTRGPHVERVPPSSASILARGSPPRSYGSRRDHSEAGICYRRGGHLQPQHGLRDTARMQSAITATCHPRT